MNRKLWIDGFCNECSDEFLANDPCPTVASHPCPTVRAIQTKLERKEKRDDSYTLD